MAQCSATQTNKSVWVKDTTKARTNSRCDKASEPLGLPSMQDFSWRHSSIRLFFSSHVMRCFFWWTRMNLTLFYLLILHERFQTQDKSIIGTARQLAGPNRERELKKDKEKFSCDPRALLSQVGVGVWSKFPRVLENLKWLVFPTELSLIPQRIFTLPPLFVNLAHSPVLIF